MRTGRAILSPLPAAILALLLTACTVELAAPYYSLEFRGKTAYASPTAASVEFRYSAEESVHRCRLLVTDSLGATVSEQTSDFTAGVWHVAGCDLPAEGRYSLRVVVQVRASDGGYVDLPFLDKSVYLYVDEHTPPPPAISPTPPLLNSSSTATLAHTDVPEGSPVQLRYTLDGNPPGEGSPLYAGGEVPIAASPTPVTLKAVAIDEAGNHSSLSEYTYRFVDIQCTDPSSISAAAPSGFVELHGYGFAAFPAQASLDVWILDPDGTAVNAVITSALPDDGYIQIAYNRTNIAAPGSVAGFNTGTGTIRLFDGTGANDTIPIQIDP